MGPAKGPADHGPGHAAPAGGEPALAAEAAAAHADHAAGGGHVGAGEAARAAARDAEVHVRGVRQGEVSAIEHEFGTRACRALLVFRAGGAREQRFTDAHPWVSEFCDERNTGQCPTTRIPTR